MSDQRRDSVKRVMTVRGEGRVSVEPNIARVQMEVVTKANEVSQAQQENADLMTQVINALLQMDISRKDIQTALYTVNPVYDYKDGEQIFRGYEVRNRITAEIQAIDQTGHVVDVAVQNGVNHVSNIEFTVKDKEIYYLKALSKSLTHALHKAHTLAETMNVAYEKIPIKIVELNDQPQTAFKTYGTMETNVSTPIEPGQIVIHASVEAQFAY